MVKSLPAVQQTQVQFLGREDPLEKKRQSAAVLLPGKSHGWRSPIGYSPWGWKELDITETHTHTHTHTHTLQSTYFKPL